MSVGTTSAWRLLLARILDCGSEVAPSSAGSDWKGRTTREIVAHQTDWDMSSPVVACQVRKLGYRFMPAEAAWVLSGSNRLAEIVPYGKHMAKFSDDGLTLGGAYGPPFVEQSPYAVRALADDPASRQAVITIWRPRPGKWADVPCTVSLQWLVRNDALDCVATMRSSDAWHGVPYDVFTFSMMSAHVALQLRSLLLRRAAETRPKGRSSYGAPEKVAAELTRLAEALSLGRLYLNAGSQHLYKIDWDEARSCFESTGALFDVAPIRLDRFADPDHLVRHLRAVADRTLDSGPGQFLEELLPPLGKM